MLRMMERSRAHMTVPTTASSTARKRRVCASTTRRTVITRPKFRADSATLFVGSRTLCYIQHAAWPWRVQPDSGVASGVAHAFNPSSRRSMLTQRNRSSSDAVRRARDTRRAQKRTTSFCSCSRSCASCVTHPGFVQSDIISLKAPYGGGASSSQILTVHHIFHKLDGR